MNSRYIFKNIQKQILRKFFKNLKIVKKNIQNNLLTKHL